MPLHLGKHILGHCARRARKEQPEDTGSTIHSDLGAAFAGLLISTQEWKHRRVDSIHLESGDRGQWRTSIDLTIPDDPRLFYSSTGAQIVVPLALLAKEPMRDLDVLDGSNNPLVVLGKAENSRIAVEILIFALAVDGISSSNALRQGLHDLVSDFKLDPELSESEVREVCIKHLINTSGVTLDQVAKFSEVTRSLLSDLTRNFLLTVVLPAATVGQRQIIKFSRFWQTSLSQKYFGFKLIVGAFGLHSIGLEIPVQGVGDAESYHLEVHTPAEIISEGLVLPSTSPASAGTVDNRNTLVAHAHGSYPLLADTDENGELLAILNLGVTRRGTKLVTFLTALFTFVFFLLGLVLSGAYEQLRGTGPAGTETDPSALLLTLPAVTVGLFIASREHAIAAILLFPIRAASISCSALLLAAAASLTYQLQDPYLHWLWWVSLIVSGLIVLAMLLGEFLRHHIHGVQGLD